MVSSVGNAVIGTDDNSVRLLIVKCANIGDAPNAYDRKQFMKIAAKLLKRRTRRAPEDARALIEAAAVRVFEKHLPDQVGLREVAREAGVSRALVTHYFGTYDTLVEAVLEQRFNRMRESLLNAVVRVAAEGGEPAAILAAQRKAIAELAADPIAVRLTMYAVLSGRAAADDFFPSRVRGLKLMADVIESRTGLSRNEVESALVASLSTAIVYTVGKRVIFGALGKRVTQENEEQLMGGLDELFRAWLTRKS